MNQCQWGEDNENPWQGLTPKCNTVQLPSQGASPKHFSYRKWESFQRLHAQVMSHPVAP